MPALQPCALLLLVGSDWRIEMVSANVGMLGEVTPADVLARPLSGLIGDDATHSLRNRVSWLAGDSSEVQDFGVQWAGLTLDVRAIRGIDCYLVEAEPAIEARLADGIGIARSMVDRLRGNDPPDLAQQGIRQLQALTGFERLSLSDRNGQSIAASRDESDCPPAAACSTPRLIADRDGTPVDIEGKEHSDLIARASYLAPSDSERAQLASNGVMATMALPLFIDDEFVGTVHARHSTPRRCGAERRAVAHLFAEQLVARMARHGWAP